MLGTEWKILHDNKPKIENPLKNGLRQRAVLGLSKEWLSGETSEPSPLAGVLFFTGAFRPLEHMS